MKNNSDFTPERFKSPLIYPNISNGLDSTRDHAVSHTTEVIRLNSASHLSQAKGRHNSCLCETPWVQGPQFIHFGLCLSYHTSAGLLGIVLYHADGLCILDTPAKHLYLTALYWIDRSWHPGRKQSQETPDRSSVMVYNKLPDFLIPSACLWPLPLLPSLGKAALTVPQITCVLQYGLL